MTFIFRKLLLISGVYSGFGFSLPMACCRNQGFRGFGLGSKISGMICTNHSIRAKAHRSDEIRENNVSWLFGKDSKGSYRLAYHHVLASDNEDRDGFDQEASTDQIAVLFCNGIQSVMTGGTKVNALEMHCRKRGWECCAFDYRGHGLSSGVFRDCTLTDWIRDASNILDRILLSSDACPRRRKRVILVGSSMGAWISLHLAMRFNRLVSENSGGSNGTTEYEAKTAIKQPIGGIIGIAAGIDFLQDLYSSSTEQEQADWRANGVAFIPSRYGDPYPISWDLVENAARNWGILPSTKPILPADSFSASAPSTASSKLTVGCPVRLLHGRCDDDVSWEKSLELSNLLKGIGMDGDEKQIIKDNIEGADSTSQVVLTLIEDGDHRLSRPQDIDLLLDALDEMVLDVQ